jgi:threonine dehydrogenase-like Zn-dependent dehydrogenase
MQTLYINVISIKILFILVMVGCFKFKVITRKVQLKALVLESKNKLVYKDVSDPYINSDEVLIEIKACAICGSDVHGMDGSTGRRIPPVIMGHEASGIIVKTGKNVLKWKVGDRVTFDSTIYPLDDWYTKKGFYNLSDNRKVIGVSCVDYKKDGAMAEYLAIPHHILHRIPDSVSFNQAALVEPLSVALHAINLNPVNKNDTAVVIGAGVIGLFIIQILKYKQVSQIIAIDQQTNRLTLSKELGAKVVLNTKENNILSEISKLTKGRGADMAYEAVGLESTVRLAVDSVRKGGTVTLIGNIAPEIQLPLQKIVTKQIKIQGSCAICGEYPEALTLIEQGTINPDRLISVTAQLSEGAHWFQKLYNKEPQLLKVILNP